MHKSTHPEPDWLVLKIRGKFIKHHTISFALLNMVWITFSRRLDLLMPKLCGNGFLAWPMWFLRLNYQTLRLVRGPKPLRWLIRACLIPFWWLAQQLGIWLGQIWPNSEEETAGYFVTARKP